MHISSRGTSNRDWWPNQLNLSVLHQNSSLADPMSSSHDYAAEFSELDLGELRELGVKESAALKKTLDRIAENNQEAKDIIDKAANEYEYNSYLNVSEELSDPDAGDLP